MDSGPRTGLQVLTVPDSNWSCWTWALLQKPRRLPPLSHRTHSQQIVNGFPVLLPPLSHLNSSIPAQLLGPAPNSKGIWQLCCSPIGTENFCQPVPDNITQNGWVTYLPAILLPSLGFCSSKTNTVTQTFPHHHPHHQPFCRTPADSVARKQSIPVRRTPPEPLPESGLVLGTQKTQVLLESRPDLEIQEDFTYTRVIVDQGIQGP